jgi:DNA polymerase III sliding clamp (beta) subunit (PCNA family)
MTITETRPVTVGQDATPTPLTVNLPSGALRELVTVAVAAGKDDTLPTLTGVRIDVTADAVTFAATDRYRLAVVTYSKPRASVHASISPQDVDPEPWAEWSALVPAKALVAAIKALPKLGRTYPTSLPDAWLEWSEGTGAASLHNSLTVRGFEGSQTVRALDGEFPKYRALIPADDTMPTLDGGTIRWNVSYMADVAKLPHVRNTPVEWSFYGPAKPAVARTEGDHVSALYLLMPVRKG